MSDNVKSYVFIIVLCLVCSILLTAASSGLKGFQQKNISLDKHKNILKSVGLIQEETEYSSREIEKQYVDSIRSVWTDSDGKIIPEADRRPESLPVYLYVKGDEIQSYIIPIESRGLWGKIHGYLAIKNDGSTISGFSVYKHSETPGLGGEIEKAWFRKNFEGKKIADQSGGFVSVSVAKGDVKEMVPKAEQSHFVDGISGATLTGKYLSAGLKEILTEYEPVAVRFRKNRKGKF